MDNVEFTDFNVTTAGVAESLKKAEQLPYIRQELLTTFVDTKLETPNILDVPVEQIISAPLTRNWGEVDRPIEYLAQMIQAVRLNGINLSEVELPKLYKYGDGFIVGDDGRTRCSVAKMEGLKLIRASVSNMTPTGVVVYNETDFEIMKDRMHRGMWSGTLVENSNESSDGLGLKLFGSGKINSYEGLWVFSRDMDNAKVLYEKLMAKQDVYRVE